MTSEGVIAHPRVPGRHDVPGDRMKISCRPSRLYIIWYWGLSCVSDDVLRNQWWVVFEINSRFEFTILMISRILSSPKFTNHFKIQKILHLCRHHLTINAQRQLRMAKSVYLLAHSAQETALENLNSLVREAKPWESSWRTQQKARCNKAFNC